MWNEWSFIPEMPIPPNALEIVVEMLLDMLNVMASPLGRSDAYVELMGLDAKNANSTKHPTNRTRNVS